MMHILVAHHVSRRRTGGMSRQMGFIHDQLVADGHRIDYLCEEDVPPRLGGRVARLSFPLLVWHRAVAAARAGDRYDIINVHEPGAAAITSFRGAAGDPVVVVTSYGVERRSWEFALEERRLGRQGPGLKTRITHPLITLWQAQIALRRADHVFCSNWCDRQYLTSQFGIPIGKITRIFPGADALYATAAESRTYAKPPERVLFAATWRKNKGIEDIVPAFTELANRHSALTLVVLGAGVPARVVIHAFPETVRHRIECVNAANDVENAAAFAGADIFLLPSLFEGTPLTLIEAMMSGLPIVTTATCGMEDVITTGRNGLLVPIRSPEAITEAVGELIADADLRRRLGRNAQADARQQYTWETAAAPVREMYRNLVHSRATS